MADVSLDGEGVNMHTEGVDAVANQLRNLAGGFGAQWQAAMSQLQATLPQLGKGNMGRERIPQIRDATEQINQVGAQVQPMLNKYADSAHQAVEDYTRADRSGARAMPR